MPHSIVDFKAAIPLPPSPDIRLVRYIQFRGAFDEVHVADCFGRLDDQYRNGF